MRNKLESRKIVVLGAMTALAIVLSIVESFLSPIFPFPGVRLGLANIVTMFVLFEWGWFSGMTVVLIKSVFVLLSRGFVAFTLSLTGGIAALTVIALLTVLFRGELSILLSGIAGAVTHNLTQLFFIYILYHMNLFAYYAPWFVIFGVATGSLTAYLLRISSPIIRRNL
ncbi:MAG: Gx transporter family protein [Bacillota bacterium]|nr:Gx transporter family protein [Bacillota bacterium]